MVGELLGTSDKMREVHDLIGRVADTDVTVLIRGESGTGKELVARAIHAARRAAHRTFVKVNCAALPSELLESELFGFERGAFTGAIQQKPGKFEFAHEGTMFLDEISEMHPPLQSKLLQVLQDGEFARLGGREDVHVDVRIVAATNRDLEGAVADGQFREDLFFRLNVVCITLPPLRQRRDEIPCSPSAFLQHYAEHYNKPRDHARGRDDAAVLRVRLAGQRARAREPDQARRRPGSDESIRRELAEAIAGRMPAHGPIPALQPTAAPRAAPPPPRRRAVTEPAPSRAGHRPLTGSLKDIARQRRARSRARADLPHAAADPLEPPRGGGDPRRQLQGAALQNQGSGARQSIVMSADPFLDEDFRVLTSEAFDFVLNNELKRAVRSQNFLTLVLVEPTIHGSRTAAWRARTAVREIARLISRDVRETDLLSPHRTGASRIVLLDADLPNSMQRHRSADVAPRALRIPAAARRSRWAPRRCPTHGADAGIAAPRRRDPTGSPSPRRLAATLRTLN